MICAAAPGAAGSCADGDQLFVQTSLRQTSVHTHAQEILNRSHRTLFCILLIACYLFICIAHWVLAWEAKSLPPRRILTEHCVQIKSLFEVPSHFHQRNMQWGKYPCFLLPGGKNYRHYRLWCLDVKRNPVMFREHPREEHCDDVGVAV